MMKSVNKTMVDSLETPNIAPIKHVTWGLGNETMLRIYYHLSLYISHPYLSFKHARHLHNEYSYW